MVQLQAPPIRRLLPLVVVAFLGSCSSTPERDEELPPPTPHPEAEERTIGYHLATLDDRILAWNRLALEARGSADARKRNLLEEQIRSETRLRLGEVIAQLESGPPINRAIAATALGFSDVDEALSPLLSAVSDPDPEVRANALLGLGLLARAETPLAEVCFLVRTSDDAYIRNNAAFAMQHVVRAGGRNEMLADTARSAMSDPEAPIRAAAALVLGEIGETDAMGAVGDLLLDEAGLVCVAAARSLGLMARDRNEAGNVARQLVQVLDRVKPQHRAAVLVELVRLAGRNLGEETEPWREWAFGLP